MERTTENDSWQSSVGLPHTARYLAVVSDAKKFVGRRRHMQISRLLVGEESVGYPHVTQVFGTDRQRLDARLPLKAQPSVPPVLSEVHVQRKVLQLHFNKSLFTFRSLDLLFVLLAVSAHNNNSPNWMIFMSFCRARKNKIYVFFFLFLCKWSLVCSK